MSAELNSISLSSKDPSIMTDLKDEDPSYVYVGEINEHLICPICRQPFVEPAQTKHTFCLSCITQALQSSSLCPIDRLPLSSADISSAPKIVASLVNELIVCCPRDCGVDVERGCLEGHLKGSCDLETIQCICNKLTTRLERQTVLEAEHVDDENKLGCIHEWRQCNSCPAQFQRLNQTSHLLSCPAQQSPCQHCSILLPNSSHEIHTQTCPALPIQCPHVPLGCPQSHVPRSSLTQHLSTCPFAPLSPLLNTLLSRLSNLESQPPPPPDPEIDRLRVDLGILSQALGDLEIRFSNAVVSERIRMGEEVDRLRGQVGALRREVWLSRRRDGGLEVAAGIEEMVPTRRLSDSTTKQIVKL